MRILVGGHRLVDGVYASGSFYAPTVLANVTSDMRIAQEETFGPVAPILVFKKKDEALKCANGSPYGLAAYLYTHDMKKAIRIAERLEYGLVRINDTRIAAAKRPSEVLSKVVSVGNEAEKD